MTEINYMFGDVTYIDKKDHLVIGANHLHKIPESKIMGFIEKLNPLKGMKIESRDLPPDVPYNCVEVLAKAAMNGKPFEYIANEKKDGTTLGDIIKDYDLPIEVVEIHTCFVPLMLRDMKLINSSEEMANSMQSLFESAKERYPDLNANRAIENYFKIMKNIMLKDAANFKNISHFLNVYLLYYGQILEYEIMRPDILDFRKRINGKMGVIVGNFHAEGINNLLEGKPIEKPISWKEYKQTLSEEVLKLVESIEELISDNKD